jgi:hypothetical protein
MYTLPISGESGDQVKIPVIVSNLYGIRNFGLEMIYPGELLEYVGLLASPPTQNFDYLRGEEQVPGVVRIEGNGAEDITLKATGSLCVAVFNVREGAYGEAAIELYNFNGDILEAEVGNGEFCVEQPQMNEGSVTLEESRYRGGMLVIPVKVDNVSDLRAFGLELKFNAEKLTFLGVEQTELTNEFITVDGNEIEPGVIRVGGFSMSGVLETNQGILLNLVFEEKVAGGEAEIVKVSDDLKDFIVIK